MATIDPFSGEGDEELFSVFEEQKKAKKSLPEKRKRETVAELNADDDDVKIIEKEEMTTTKGAAASSAASASTTDTTAKDDNKSLQVVTGEEDGATKPQDDMVVNILASREGCLHEIAYPPNYVAPAEEGPRPKKAPAKEYPFVLDAFQRESVNCIERNQSVLVSAHTSAGKTAVAEYAIAMSLRDGSRVIYTSPIKALSNQKFRELSEEFQDVGLMTGDVTINPNSSCLVMTTEILRAMLYRGSEILNEVAWVIFDEVHYMRDKERGVVWEETMILLPNTVRYVFLSATIPNAKEFAEWIAKLKGQPVHVVYTDYRPTPLQHYIYPSGGDGIMLVVNEKAQFKEDNFQKAIQVLQAKSTQKQAKERASKRRKTDDGSDIYKIVKMIMERNFQPVIVFSFSRKDVEALAVQMKKLDLNDEEEKALVEEVFRNAIDSLSDDDKKLPQVEHMLPLLKRGIGIHHSGLLPIIKEVIEILFQEGLVKCLFSTETFSMGLNMPARTVVFTQITKFDGTDFRTISSGEYIQMSGRAGRRGIDDRGIVILMLDEEIDQTSARKMMSGKADPLNSSFHLSYYMILNLLRVEEINPEYIMERSFYQFQSEKQRPVMEEQLKKIEEEKDKIKIENEQQVSSYYHTRQKLEEHRNELREIVTKPIHAIPFLQPGRVVKVRDGATDWGWGVVVNFQRVKSSGDNEALAAHKASEYVVDVLLNCAPPVQGSKKLKPCPEGKKGEMNVIPVQLDMIESISSIRLFLNKNLNAPQSRDAALSRLTETKKRFPDGIPALDPIEDMQIESKNLKNIVKNIETLEQRMVANPMNGHAKIAEIYAEYAKKVQLDEEIKLLKKKIKNAGQLVLKEDLKKMMRVLRRLGCITEDNVIDVKGRVAAEVSAGDELLITELMFNGVFNDLSPQQVVALVSCLVFNEKAGEVEKVVNNLPEELQKPFRQLQEAAKRIAKVSEESKIEINSQDYIYSFSPNLMQVTYAWCNGAKFYEICKMTEVFEGSIVRAMRRLEELLRQMCVAAKSIGDKTLEEKFLQGIQSLKRDIVFSSSLYL